MRLPSARTGSGSNAVPLAIVTPKTLRTDVKTDAFPVSGEVAYNRLGAAPFLDINGPTVAADLHLPCRLNVHVVVVLLLVNLEHSV